MALPEPIQPMMSYMQPNMQQGMNPMMMNFNGGQPPMSQPPVNRAMPPMNPAYLQGVLGNALKPKADPNQLQDIQDQINQQEDQMLNWWQQQISNNPWTWRGKLTPAMPGG